MIGLEGRLQWRRHQLFKLRAKPPAAQKRELCQFITHAARQIIAPRRNRYSHSKFAIRSNVVRRTKFEQAEKPGPYASSVAFAIIGFGALPSPGFIRNS
jgi:hypothetical protein